MNQELVNAHKWLLNDQYNFGEWGKHEITNPTDEPRQLYNSEIKPNIFSSIYAYYTLIATNAKKGDWYVKFFSWLEKLRNDEGYWTSASGAKMPFGQNKSFSKVINIRHSAKGLDLLLMTSRFVPEDVIVFNHIIGSQFSNGAFPQMIDGKEDLWSTAYVINLLIRATLPGNIKLTLPRNKNINGWTNELTNKLEKAKTWLIDQLDDSGLWKRADVDPIWLSEAMMIEVGAYLSMHSPDMCSSIVKKILENRATRQASKLLCAYLVFETLEPLIQKDVLERTKDLKLNWDNNAIDILEVTSYCKLQYIKDNEGLLNYYKLLSNGHESCLIKEESWKLGNYFLWNINNYKNKKFINRADFAPIVKSDSWNMLLDLLKSYKQQVENERLWELLWENKINSKDEKAIQLSFFSFTNPLFKNLEIKLIRESETGRGPVDFEFVNGFKSRILIEFKLASNDALNRNFYKQILEYLKGAETDSAFFVIVGFNEKDKNIMEKVEDEIFKFCKDYPNYFVSSIYISAERKIGASKHD